MAFKFLCFAALLAVASAGNLLSYTSPVVAPVPLVKTVPAVPIAKAVAAVDTQYDPHPQYNYAYDIQDAITGDNKGHQEIRDGDVVQGRYFLIDADGTRRTVEYTADPVNGFNAVVHREPLTVPVVKTVAPVAPLVYRQPIVAAPVIKTAVPVAPLTYTAPIAKTFIH